MVHMCTLLQAGDAYGLFDLPSYDFRNKLTMPVDAAFNLNRSIVGIHAAEVLQAAAAVGTAGCLPGLPGMRNAHAATQRPRVFLSVCV